MHRLRTAVASGARSNSVRTSVHKRNASCTTVLLAALFGLAAVQAFSSPATLSPMRGSPSVAVPPSTAVAPAALRANSHAAFVSSTTTGSQAWAKPSHRSDDDDHDSVTDTDTETDSDSSERSLPIASKTGRGGQRPNWMNASTAVVASVIAVAALAASPAVSYASDAMASTNAFLSGISETGFYQAFSLVFVSEIGDKTFFMAGLLAVQTSRFVSFLGSMAALGVMTVISVAIGQIFHAVPSGLGEGVPLDDIAAALAFAFFGYKTLKEALEMDPNAGSVMDEELAEAQEEVDGSNTSKQATLVARVLSIFGLVFAAEFGDRSFLSTIALSAAQNPFSVAFGAIAAHAVATGIAVAGGAALSKYLSERVIGIIGGSLFLVFAATTAFGIF